MAPLIVIEHLDVHVTVVGDQRIDEVLAGQAEILATLNALAAATLGGLDDLEAILTTDFTALESAVAATTDAEQSAITLIRQLAQDLTAHAGDQEAVLTFAQQLTERANALGAAVVSGTPAAPSTPTSEEPGVDQPDPSAPDPTVPDEPAPTDPTPDQPAGDTGDTGDTAGPIG